MKKGLFSIRSDEKSFSMRASIWERRVCKGVHSSKGITMNKFLMAVSVIAITSGTALAQDPSAAPSFGDVSLTTGYTPDPYMVSITSGGLIDARGISPSCAGWVANAPDFDLYFTAGSLPLTIAAMSDSDTTLVVNAPDGRWYCNDDGGQGLNPLLTFNNAQSGLYDIWIGSYRQGDFANATLSISEIGQVGGAPINSNPQVGPAPSYPIPQPNGPDFTLNPTAGSVNLSAGYAPDPHTARIVSGGAFRAYDTSSNCAGWVSEAPDYAVNYNAGGFDLTFGVDSGSDTTLMINDPNGNWICNDDGGVNLNPLITFSNPQSGRYDVWIGSYSQGEFANSTLSVSEVGQVAPHRGTPVANRIDMSLPASFGSANLSSGFAPDPYRVNIVSGGQFRASSARNGCAGWVAGAPDFQLTFNAGSLPLILSAASNSDTTILVNDPNGNWHCDDDGGNAGLNPALSFYNPSSGVYDIWIGSYAQGDNASASLSISELYSE